MGTNLNDLLAQYTSHYSTDWAEFRVTRACEIFRNEIAGNVALCCNLPLKLKEFVRITVVIGTARIGSILVPECLQGCRVGW